MIFNRVETDPSAPAHRLFRSEEKKTNRKSELIEVPFRSGCFHVESKARFIQVFRPIPIGRASALAKTGYPPEATLGLPQDDMILKTAVEDRKKSFDRANREIGGPGNHFFHKKRHFMEGGRLARLKEN